MSASKLPWELAKKRANYISIIREFFYQRSVVEVETPLLSNNTVTDTHLDAFSTNYQYFPDSNIDKTSLLYLQTSPEFAMKRLLSSGYGSIFQISKAFRREAFGRFHNPEFTMLEWYRIGFNINDLICEVSDLLTTILDCGSPEVISYQDVFLKITALDPLEVSSKEIKLFLTERGINETWIAKEKEKDILLQYIFSHFVEPCIGLNVPCFVYDFPRSQAALAKVSEVDQRVAHRFECYFQGVELANGYDELADVQEQIIRFNRDNETRKRLGKEELPIDSNFIDAMNVGFPDCSGVALGLDRLMMIALQQDKITDVITFGIESA